MKTFVALLVLGTISWVIILEATYRSIQFRECVYKGLNREKMTEECKELFDMRRGR